MVNSHVSPPLQNAKRRSYDYSIACIRDLNVCIPLDLHALDWIDAPVRTLQGGLRVTPSQWLDWTVSQ